LNFLVKALLTAVIVVLMVPGLIIEPGPISEIIGIGFLASIWGLDFMPGGESGGS
jgi:hypothetical protein